MTQISGMRILLIGEYSRFHNSLKEGLLALGHEVTLVGTGDAFKGYPVDINIKPTWTVANWLVTRFKNLWYRCTGVDLCAVETGIRFWNNRKQFHNYDIVQFINSWSIRTTIAREKKYITYLETHNDKLFLSACGTDVPFVEAMFEEHPFPYTILTPYLNDNSLKNSYIGTFKYLTQGHKSLYEHILTKVRAIIPADVDYLWGLRQIEKTTPLIPMPINTDILTYIPLNIEGKIVIFHGINRLNYIKKGNNFFEEALQIIEKKYPEKVTAITAENMPYTEYINAYDRAHILLDQATSLDQGYNAREAMAKGKIVFTGAEKEFIEHYLLEETVAINAKPDTQYLVDQLEKLILNPERILEISKNARAFIEREHHFKKVAQRYLDTWNRY